MKSLAILRKLISIYYYLMLIIFAIGMIVIPYRISIREKTEIMFVGDVIDLTQLSSLKINTILLSLGGLYILYILAIKLVKDTVDKLSTGVMFTMEISRNFKNIGIYFLVIGVCGAVIKVLIAIIALRQINISIEGTMLVFILFGLFFMFLSEAFAKAKAINEENDLTI